MRTTLACDLRVRRDGPDLATATPLTGPLRDLLSRDGMTVVARELPLTTAGTDRTRSSAQLVTVGAWVGLPRASGVARVLREARRVPAGPVVCFMDLVGMLTAIGVRRTRGPIILFGRGRGTAAITFAGRYPRPVLLAAEAVGKSLRALAVRRADYLVTVSGELARALGAKSAFIAPEVDWPALTTAPEASGPRDLNTALFVGRLELEKGPELAIRACAAASGIDRLVVLGSGSLKSRLERIAGEVRPELDVEFIPFMTHSDVLSLCQRVRVLLAPSYSEGFGLAAFEAIAMGAAVVASDVGGLPEAVGGADRARLVPNRFVEDWASAIEESSPGTRMTDTDLGILRQARGWWTLEEVIDHVAQPCC